MTDEQYDNEMRWWNEKADTLDGLNNPRQPTGEVGKNGAPVYEKLPEHEVEEKTYQFALNTLGEKCDFLRNAYPYLFVRDENLLVPMAEDSKALQLLGRLRLRARQKHTGLVLSNLKLHIDEKGRDVEMAHWGLLKNDAVYINDGRGGVIKVTPRCIEDDLPNGTDGVYMDDPKVKPWPRLDENGNSAKLDEIQRTLGGKGLLVTDTPLCRYLKGLYEQRTLGPAEYAQLFMARYLALFMRGATSLLPIVFPMGEQGSGKSTLVEKVLWLVEGFGAKAQAMPKDLRGLIAKLTNNHVALLDNCDRTKWEEDNRLDYLCTASTGGEVPIAQLYETNTVRNYRLHCDIFVTARSNGWPESATDAGRRTLFFPLRKPAENEQKDRDKWERDVALNRDAYLLETLARLQCCVRALARTADVAYPKVSEMPEFENFTMRIAGFEGWGGEMRRMWEGYMADYRGVAVEHSPLVNAVVAWSGSPQGLKAVREGLWASAAEIYKVLQEAFGENKMALAALSSACLNHPSATAVPLC